VDNLEKKELQVYQEYPVALEVWENEVQLDLKDHPVHLEQTH